MFLRYFRLSCNLRGQVNRALSSEHIEQYLDLPLITGRDMLKARTSEHKNGFLGHKKNYSSEILNDVCTLKT